MYIFYRYLKIYVYIFCVLLVFPNYIYILYIYNLEILIVWWNVYTIHVLPDLLLCMGTS